MTTSSDNSTTPINPGDSWPYHPYPSYPVQPVPITYTYGAIVKQDTIEDKLDKIIALLEELKNKR